MSDDKKMTEEQLRHETRKEFGFSEERDKERIDRAVQLKKDRYTAIQAKKKAREEAELKAKQNSKGETKPKQGNNYSIADIRALSKIDNDEDVEWFEEHCKKVGLSPSEAIKDDYVQFKFQKSEEERRTAQATSTDKGRQKTGGKEDERILDDIESGKFPDKDDDYAKAAKARIERKRANLQR